MPRPARSLGPVLLLAALLAIATVAPARQPEFSFGGQLPSMFQMHQRPHVSLFTPEGTELDSTQIAAIFDIELGDPVVLVRGGEVVARAKVGAIIAREDPRALDGRLLYFRPVDVTPEVPIPERPTADVLVDDGYDLWIFTEMPVEVLAPDPRLQGYSWGVHDYCVRVGRLRFGIIRERQPGGGDGFRGWQVQKFVDDGTMRKVTADYTWQQPRRR